ncbi:uncharacterized protein LOC135943109 isoform X1 [Cloeon dipterum]|uniref:uncharacterized protein LOC135943109 isoform X1 n=1 Tax=Cloeon dipterum TaxID=197152 RepID=UPI00321FDA06
MRTPAEKFVIYPDKKDVVATPPSRAPLQQKSLTTLNPNKQKAVASPKKCDENIEINQENCKPKAAFDLFPSRKFKLLPETKSTTEISTQTNAQFEATGSVTAEDLIEDTPSEHYWERLAKNKAASLEKALEENRLLKEQIKALESDMKIKDEMLEEARAMAEVIKELVD